jgi:hypothetical protein
VDREWVCFGVEGGGGEAEGGDKEYETHGFFLKF